MKEISFSEVPENRLFDHLDDLLIAIGDDTLNLATYMRQGVAILRKQAIVSVLMAVLLTVVAVPRFLSGGTLNGDFILGLYSAFILATAVFASSAMTSYASYSKRCADLVNAAQKFKETKVELL